MTRRARRRLRRMATLAVFVMMLPGLLLVAPFLGIVTAIDMLLQDDWWRA